MDSALFWLLFLCWACLCLFLDQMSRTPIFNAERTAAEPVSDPD